MVISRPESDRLEGVSGIRGFYATVVGILIAWLRLVQRKRERKGERTRALYTHVFQRVLVLRHSNAISVCRRDREKIGDFVNAGDTPFQPFLLSTLKKIGKRVWCSRDPFDGKFSRSFISIR